MIRQRKQTGRNGVIRNGKLKDRIIQWPKERKYTNNGQQDTSQKNQH